MNNKPDAPSRLLIGLGKLILLAWLHLLAGCSSSPSVPGRERFEGSGPSEVLAYYQALSRLPVGEFNRERNLLAALPPTADMQLRQAMLLGHPRAGMQDLARALTLLDGVVKSPEATAVALRPLARLLAEHYAERQKQEGQLERQAQQLKESQRKTAELQEKLDALAEIERTLPPRSRSGRQARPGEAR